MCHTELARILIQLLPHRCQENRRNFRTRHAVSYSQISMLLGRKQRWKGVSPTTGPLNHPMSQKETVLKLGCGGRIIFITNRAKCFWYLEDKDSVAINVGFAISHIVNTLSKSEFISSVQPRDLVYLNVLQEKNLFTKGFKDWGKSSILLTYAIYLIWCCGFNVSSDKL